MITPNENSEGYGGDTVFIVEKIYEDGWKWYCGYPTLKEAKDHEKIVQERDKRETRVRVFFGGRVY